MALAKKLFKLGMAVACGFVAQHAAMAQDKNPHALRMSFADSAVSQDDWRIYRTYDDFYRFYVIDANQLDRAYELYETEKVPCHPNLQAFFDLIDFVRDHVTNKRQQAEIINAGVNLLIGEDEVENQSATMPTKAMVRTFMEASGTCDERARPKVWGLNKVGIKSMWVYCKNKRYPKLPAHAVAAADLDNQWWVLNDDLLAMYRRVSKTGRIDYLDKKTLTENEADHLIMWQSLIEVPSLFRQDSPVCVPIVGFDTKGLVRDFSQTLFAKSQEGISDHSLNSDDPSIQAIIRSLLRPLLLRNYTIAFAAPQ
jgi:hypothetical protein